MKQVEEIAERLKEMRKQAGLTQADMRLKIGMSQQQYQRIESGADMKLSTLLRVLEGLGQELEFADGKVSPLLDLTKLLDDDS